jgi:hypothetical protein
MGRMVDLGEKAVWLVWVVGYIWAAWVALTWEVKTVGAQRIRAALRALGYPKTALGKTIDECGVELWWGKRGASSMETVIQIRAKRRSNCSRPRAKNFQVKLSVQSGN